MIHFRCDGFKRKFSKRQSGSKIETNWFFLDWVFVIVSARQRSPRAFDVQFIRLYFLSSIESINNLKDSAFLFPIKKAISSISLPSKLGISTLLPLN